MAQHIGPDPKPVTAQDVERVCGRIGDAKIVAIVEAEPSYEDLEEAAAWLADEGEPLRAIARPLTGKTAIVYRILESDLGGSEER
jgi:hypothetical protein